MVGWPMSVRADEPTPPPPNDMGLVTPAPPPPGTPSGTTLPDPTTTTPEPSIDVTPPAPTPPQPATVAPIAAAPVPQTSIRYRRPHVSLLAAGLASFVAGWMGDVGFTYGYNHEPEWTSLIPIAGPFIQMTQHYGLDGPPVNTGNPDADARITKNLDTADHTIRGLSIAGETFAAVLQLTGVALTIAGAVMKRRIAVYAVGGLPTIRF
jgi:hypothetical protein